MHWLLLYEYVDDVVERRAPFRDTHLALARRTHDEGTLLLAGALGDPVDGAAFVFATGDRAAVEAFVREDPYVGGGLVPSWTIRPWNVVVGGAPNELVGKEGPGRPRSPDQYGWCGLAASPAPEGPPGAVGPAR